ncbi:hypothetical protein [Streptomyces sp. SR-10]|uniref:hypothetical protein n=1 Tax=Streptomyces sp. SR-10 TaxID=3416442 RepID=UPI003CEC2CE6
MVDEFRGHDAAVADYAQTTDPQLVARLVSELHELLALPLVRGVARRALHGRRMARTWTAPQGRALARPHLKVRPAGARSPWRTSPGLRRRNPMETQAIHSPKADVSPYRAVGSKLTWRTIRTSVR